MSYKYYDKQYASTIQSNRLPNAGEVRQPEDRGLNTEVDERSLHDEATGDGESGTRPIRNRINMKKLHLILLPVLLIGLFISYNIGFKRAVKTNDKYIQEIIKETLINNPAAKFETCISCDIQSFDADGDGWSNPETIIIEEVGMSQMAGRVIIIKEGKIVFTSQPKMRILVDPIRSFDYNNGFIISYSTETNSNTAITRDFYKYINGKYILVRTVNKDTPQVTYYAKLDEINRVTTSFYWYDLETKKIKDSDKENAYFYASHGYVFGDNDSEKWNELINNNKDSVFKITGIKSESHCDDKYDDVCRENIIVDDIEIIE